MKEKNWLSSNDDLVYQADSNRVLLVKLIVKLVAKLMVKLIAKRLTKLLANFYRTTPVNRLSHHVCRLSSLASLSSASQLVDCKFVKFVDHRELSSLTNKHID